MPSGTKPIPEPMLTQIFVAIASLGQNELIGVIALFLQDINPKYNCILQHQLNMDRILGSMMSMIYHKVEGSQGSRAYLAGPFNNTVVHGFNNLLKINTVQKLKKKKKKKKRKTNTHTKKS